MTKSFFQSRLYDQSTRLLATCHRKRSFAKDKAQGSCNQALVARRHRKRAEIFPWLADHPALIHAKATAPGDQYFLYPQSSPSWLSANKGRAILLQMRSYINSISGRICDERHTNCLRYYSDIIRFGSAFLDKRCLANQ